MRAKVGAFAQNTFTNAIQRSTISLAWFRSGVGDPADSPLFRNIEAAIKRRHADAVVTPILIPYGTDSNAFRPKGVKSYGVFPAILSGETVASMHGDAERVPLDGVSEAAQLFFEALRDTLQR